MTEPDDNRRMEPLELTQGERISLESRLVRIETKIDLSHTSYEQRLSRLENGLVGTMVTLLIAIAVWAIDKF